MLTSAGCNALDYLLDDPEHIFCVDINPSQNALLNFKRTLFKKGSHRLLWDLFGKGKKRGAEFLYQQKLRQLLSEQERTFWDSQISSCFMPTSNEPSFYYRGTTGKFALMVRDHIKQKGLYSSVLKLLNARSLEEQTFYFNEIEPRLWDSFQKWFISQNATMAMLGVPVAQRKMIDSRYEGGLLHYIRKVLREIFTEQPVYDNYFWRVYLTGSYTPNCCPNYLLEQNFDMLSNRIGRIRTYNTSLTDFLRENPSEYSHYVLLDHQDWMVHTKPGLLRKEWRFILKNSIPGTRILFRSASPDHSFLPHFVRNELEFHPEITESLHKNDRVGTYESTHLATVK